MTMMAYRKLLERSYEQPGGQAGGGTVPPGNGTPPPTPPADPWYKGKVDDRTIGHWQNRFAAKMNDPAELALAVTQSYLEAERFIGAPPNQIVRLPQDPKDEAGWKAVWSKLGAPGDAKDYALTGPDGKPLPADVDALLRDTASKTNMTKDAASAMASAVAKHLESSQVQSAANKQAALQQEHEALQKNWGANVEANKLLAKLTAQKLGVGEAEVVALEQAVGYAKVMEMFRSLGQRMGEDKFITNNGSGVNNGIMSVQQAVARRSELMADKAWVDRYFQNDAQCVREMSAVNTIIASA